MFPPIVLQPKPDFYRAFFFKKIIMHKSPNTLAVQRLRSKVQKNFDLNINQARCWCAAAALAEPRQWLGWETGAFEMPPATYQLVQVKALLVDRALFSVSPDIPGVRYTSALSIYWRSRTTDSKKMKPVQKAKKAES